jgi:hypothetical protein
MPAPRVMPAFPNALVAQRANHAPDLPTDYHYVFGPDPSPAAEERTLRIADLMVARDAGRLVVVHRDGRYRGDILAFMGHVLTLLSGPLLQIYPRDEHAPRITIDDVIVVRQSWSWSVADLEFASAKTALGRWLGAQRWRREQELPRFVFVRTPLEPKPVFLDFDSPIYVETLARYLRNARRADGAHRLTAAEMVPDLDQLWLEDDRGDRFTSEIRLVMVERPTREEVER